METIFSKAIRMITEEVKEKKRFRVFTRKWWSKNKNWPDGKEPGPGPKKVLKKGIESEASARDFCRVWNINYKEDKLGRRCEYESY